MNKQDTPFTVNWERIAGQLDRVVGRVTTQTETDLRKAGCYEYIPLAYTDFVEQLECAKRVLGERWKTTWKDYDGISRTDLKFVDVGCGIGTKGMIAHQFGLSPYGIEINPRYAASARYALGSSRVIQGDAREQDYSTYDIIYFYCPMYVEAGQRQLERRIVRTAKPGAIILANLKRSSDKFWYHSKVVKSVGDSEYLADVVFKKL